MKRKVAYPIAKQLLPYISVKFGALVLTQIVVQMALRKIKYYIPTKYASPARLVELLETVTETFKSAFGISTFSINAWFVDTLVDIPAVFTVKLLNKTEEI